MITGKQATRLVVLFFCAVTQSLIPNPATASPADNFKFDGSWAMFATQQETSAKTCNGAHTYFVFRDDRMYLGSLDKNGKAKIEAGGQYKANFDSEISEIRIAHPALAKESIMHFSVIDKDRLAIIDHYDFNAETAKYEKTVSTKFFLKRC